MFKFETHTKVFLHLYLNFNCFLFPPIEQWLLPPVVYCYEKVVWYGTWGSYTKGIFFAMQCEEKRKGRKSLRVETQVYAKDLRNKSW